jgi:hypothetical protein
MSDAYRGIRTESVGVNINEGAEGDKDLWRTKEDKARIEAYAIYKDLYDGKHCQNEGGPYLHPYAGKLQLHRIPYVQSNLLNKCSRTYADLIASENPEFTAENPQTEAVLDSIDFGLPLWEAVIQCSIYGFVGLIPSQKGKLKLKTATDLVSSWSWELIKPEQIFIEFVPMSNEIKTIKNKIYCPEVDTEIGKINILYEETHTKNSIEIRLYKIEDDKIIRELPI